MPRLLIGGANTFQLEVRAVVGLSPAHPTSDFIRFPVVQGNEDSRGDSSDRSARLRFLHQRNRETKGRGDTNATPLGGDRQ